MRTDTARPLWQRCLSAITAVVMVLGMIPFMPAQSVLAATQTLGGATVDGNLKIDVYDDGTIGLFRYDSANSGADVWETLTYHELPSDPPNKNSRLQYTGGGYTFGWPNSMVSNPTDVQATAVSNTTVGDTVITVFTAGNTTVTQTVSYSNGDDFIRYDWAIQNISSTALSDLRFFHGMDTCLGLDGYDCNFISDTGAGLWFPAARAVGVRHVDGSTETRFYLQGVTPPENYDSLDYADMWDHMSNGALTDALNTDPDTDNGYALEWRQASLDAGAVWTITAYERFSIQPFDSVFVVAPPLTEIAQGASEDLIYTLTNDDAAGVDVDLSVSQDQPTWDATLQGATTVNVPANSSITVTVQVTVPGSASIGATGVITLTADGPGAGVSADAGQVLVTAGTVQGGLDVSKTAEDLNGAPLQAGDEIRYTILITNSSATTTHTNVRITDTLPSGVTFVAASPAGYGGPNPVTWSVASMIPSATWTGYLTVTVDDNVSVIGGNVVAVSSDQEEEQQVGPILPPGGGEVIQDVTPPTVTSPVTGTAINDPTPTISGTAEPGALITVTLEPTGTVLCTAVADPSGNWTCTPTTPIPDGEAEIHVVAGDGAGHESDPTVVVITVDTIPPAPPTVTAPISGTTTGTTPTFAGTGEPGGTVNVYDDQGNVVCTTTVNPDGSWSCTPDDPLDEGEQTYSVTVTDEAGNESDPTPVTITVDSGGVTPPTVTSPISGTAINDPTPTISGTAEPGALITVTLEPTGTVLCTAVADPSGNWTCTPTTPIPDGDAEIHVVAGDGAGHESDPTVVVVTVDTIPPAPPVVTGPISGTVITDPTPVFTGTGEPGGTVNIYDDQGNVVCTTTVNPDGSWSCTPDDPLDEGEQTYSVTVTDEAGNESDPTPVTITVDSGGVTPPTVTSPITGTAINDPTPTISGTAEPGALITVTLEPTGTVLCTAVADPSGNWTCTPTTPIPDGEAEIHVVAGDGAGHVSDPTVVIVTVDTIPPDPPVVTGPISGTVITDPTPVFTGTGEPGGTVNIYDDQGNVVCTTTVAPDGSWSCTPDDPLDEGEQTYQVTVTDEAGNESDPTDVTITVDSGGVTPPTVTSPISGTAINDPTPTISGTAEPGALITVTLEPTGTVLCTAVADPSGNWTCTPTTPIPDGEAEIHVVAGDGAGHESDPTVVVITVDTIPPAPPTVTAPISGTTTGTTPTFAGTGEPGGTVNVYDDQGNVVCTTTVNPDGSWTCTPTTPLDEGEQTYQVTVTDEAGNESDPTPVTITVDSSLNNPPVAVEDAFRVPESVPAQPSSTLDVLANDRDPDGDAITITQVSTPGHGAATTNGRTIVYTPTAGYLGPDSFTYILSDGEFTDTAQVSVTILPVADLAVSQHIRASIGGYTITIVARNLGPRPAPGAVVSDTFPAAVGATIHWTCVAEGGADCPNASGAGNLEETLATFPAGGVVTYTVSASGGTNEIVWNTVTITPPSEMFDLAMENNSDSQLTVYRVILPLVYKRYIAP